MKGLNDAKYTAAVVYIITVLLIVYAVAAVLFNLNDYVNASSSIFGAVVWMGATLILGFVFIPKVLAYSCDNNNNYYKVITIILLGN